MSTFFSYKDLKLSFSSKCFGDNTKANIQQQAMFPVSKGAGVNKYESEGQFEPNLLTLQPCCLLNGPQSAANIYNVLTTLDGKGVLHASTNIDDLQTATSAFKLINQSFSNIPSSKN